MIKAREIQELFDVKNIPYEFIGNSEVDINFFSSIYTYKIGTLSWIRDKDTFVEHELNGTGYTALIITPEMKDMITADATFIVETDPKEVFFEIVDTYWGEDDERKIASTAVIEDGATLGINISVGHHCFISKDAVIGDNCVLCANVVLMGKISIGNNCYIGPGVNIGVEGFGFNTGTDNVAHYRHYGGVTIGNGVFVGANTCICRGAIDDTYIEDYVKINNLCHIAHNDVIGKRTVITAGTVIMGSIHIGEGCWISSATLRDQISVGNKSVVGMGSVVTKNVGDNTTVVGVPAKSVIRHEKV